MINQTRIAIISIAVIIPLSSFAVLNSSQSIILDEPKINEQKVVAIVSFFPLYDFTKEIGREKVDVTLLVPAGVEPHDWGPTIKDVQRMQKSDLIIINGVGFENWVDSLDETDYQGVIVDTSNGILVKNFGQEYTRTFGDPHIWLNPVYAKTQVQNIANAFSNSDPKNQQYYQSNAAKYIEELDLLDSKIRNELSTCNHDFVAFHDAFSYFAYEYNLNQHTIISSNDPHGEATARTLENVISTAKELNISVIFSEENVNTRTSEIIANEIDGKVLVLSPLEVSSDGTYISKMIVNLNNLKEALC